LKRRGSPSSDHPESVATTWSLSFEKVERADPAAAELLRFCAFLSPDAIPEEIITEGASELGSILKKTATSSLKLNEAIGLLLRFSLVYRYRATKTLNIHRLVQAVLIDSMDKQLQHQWAQRTVRAVNRAFPDVEFETWQRCQRYLPHAQVCSRYIKQWNMEFAEAERLIEKSASYLYDTKQYVQAKPLYEQSLMIGEKLRGLEHPSTASDLNNLGTVYYALGEYTQAEQYYARALAIRNQVLEPNHPDLAASLNNLAALYRDQGKECMVVPKVKTVFGQK
jgi:tetratricopeptide (TPR) repeat protein